MTTQPQHDDEDRTDEAEDEGSGVREPRRPRPSTDSAGASLPLPQSKTPLNALAQYRSLKGLTDEQIALDLSEKLGKKITTQSVTLWRKKPKTPKTWAAALELGPDPDPVPETSVGEPATPPPPAGERPESEPPKPPLGKHTIPASSTPAQGSESAVVEDRIAKMYGAIGAGVAIATRNDGYGQVADAYSHDLARAWIAAAKENAQVAKIVAFLESGGPVGELVIAHVVLVGGFIYVSGRGPDLDFLYAGKFGSFRAAQLRARAAEAEAANLNGSGDLHSTSAVGDFER